MGKRRMREEESLEKGREVGGITGEVRRLIDKYGGGRIPVLVDEKKAEEGLVNEKLLKIYQMGFGAWNLIPLGVLYAKLDKEGCKEAAKKWRRGCADYHLNDLSKKFWTNVCKAIRSTGGGKGNEECEHCDRRHAELVEKAENVNVIAYMCVHGLVDVAMPMFVDGEVIAVIFTGQRIPKEGSRWNKEFVEKDGVFSLEKCSKDGVEARKVTLELLEKAEQAYGMTNGILLEKLEEDAREGRGKIEVSPEGVGNIQRELTEAGDHLSRLAQSKYELEKSKAVAGLRGAVARSVADVEVDIERPGKTLPSIVGGISEAAGLICKYFGLDYMLALNLKNEESSFRLLLEHAPCKSPWDKGMWAGELDEEAFRAVEEEISRLSELDDADLWPWRKLPFFEWVSTWLRGKQASKCVATRLNQAGLSPCVLIGGRENGLQLSDFREQDRKDLSKVIGDITTVINVLLFIEELHWAGEAQELFSEDVAHDIRNPVQNLLFMIERLKFGVGHGQVDAIGAQVRRIHKLSERVWLLEQIRKEGLQLDKTGRVGVYEVVMEAVAMVRYMAEEKNVGIKVSPEMKKWRAIQVDRKFFFQAMLNLLDNAVKYSREGTEVRIDGKTDWPNCRIFVINRGIEIKDKYKESIYKRGSRTPEAQMHIRDGSGIGLGIVKAFADIYGKISCKCEPVYGTYDFVTEFQLGITGDIL